MDGDHPRFSAEEARVVGAMVEKAMTTPDNYPMSLNAVVVACNQVSNREPVVEFSESQVELVLRELADRGLAKLVHRPGDRVVKYRHAVTEAIELDDERLALLAVLLLRGAQTPGELRQRTGRYVEFSSLPAVEIALEAMRARGLVHRLERRPGQKEHRYVELLGPGSTGEHLDEEPAGTAQPGVLSAADEDDVADLREDLAELRRRFDALLEQLGVEDI
jgi:uncharacterized protein YceH (UPF0502 family)